MERIFWTVQTGIAVAAVAGLAVFGGPACTGEIVVAGTATDTATEISTDTTTEISTDTEGGGETDTSCPELCWSGVPCSVDADCAALGSTCFQPGQDCGGGGYCTCP